MPGIRNVVFDVGNVLLKWDPVAIVNEQLADDSQRQRVLEGMFQHPDWDALDRGALDEREATLTFCERTGLDQEIVARLMLASKADLTEMTEGVQLLKELHQRQVGLYCLTNMSRGTFEFVHPRFSFWQYFRGMIVSAFLRMAKPDAEIFQRLLDTYRLDPSATVFLDDNPANVRGAQALGIVARCYDDPASVQEWLWREIDAA